MRPRSTPALAALLCLAILALMTACDDSDSSLGDVASDSCDESSPDTEDCVSASCEGDGCDSGCRSTQVCESSPGTIVCVKVYDPPGCELEDLDMGETTDSDL